MDYVTDKHGEQVNPSTGLGNFKLAIWIFLSSDVLFFGAFIGTYLAYRNKSLVGPYPNEVLDIPITTISTFVLILSSFAVVIALSELKKNNLAKAKFWLFSVILLGLAFLGFQVYEFAIFAHEGLTPQVNLFGTTFFILTGFHGTHVAIGVIWLIILYTLMARGKLDSKKAINLEVSALYWHFVDIVWIVIFTVIYLISAGDGADTAVVSISKIL